MSEGLLRREGEARGVGVVARDVGLVDPGYLRLALVAVVLSGGSDVGEGYETGAPVLCDGKDPVVVAVEDPHSLPFPYRELLVATRGVVPDGRHPEVGRSVFGGSG